MKTKETWIDETLTALDGMNRATAPPDLLFKIQAKTAHTEHKTAVLQRPFYLSVAAGIALLITLNIFGLLNYHQTQKITREIPAAVANDYLSYLSPIKF
jgi:thiosulfate reductase cytochrome b subunit